jgi:divalent metal cation (Fe/Co/Zn/Cd) transporter
MEELKDLKRISETGFYSSLGITTLFIIFAVITGSTTLLTYFIWALAAIIVRLFALITIRIMLNQNQYLFPYGCGKLENFSSFFFGFAIVPLGIFFLVLSINKFLYPLSEIKYILCQIPIVISFLRSLLLTVWTRRMVKKYADPSPLVKAYYVDFRVALTSDTFLFLAFFAGFLLNILRLNFLSIRVDPFLSVILSLYMIRVGLPLIIDNFRALIDLPLPEKDMLRILKVTTEFYKDFSGFGMLYSRRSGKQKIIEMELFFDSEISFEKISHMEQQMTLRLNSELSNVDFRIIPKLKK